ncbi:MAG TPA: ATP-binding protein, partial [Myxococcaceae bacterium]|nr:ATP-binding protein [Myxococcaceae bacterium]
EELHSRVRVEAGRIQRVLSPLLLNIAMGQPEGTTIAVNIRRGPRDEVQIQVVDSSTEPPEDASSVFQPFSSMLARGAGLSLAALQRVMESHGGKVTADWSSPPGTLYTLSFPA